MGNCTAAMIPTEHACSEASTQVVKPMLAHRGDHKLELVFLWIDEQDARHVIPRSQIRKHCESHERFNQKVLAVLKALRAINMAMLNASPQDSTIWAISQSKLDILKNGAQDDVIHGLNDAFDELLAYIIPSTDTHRLQKKTPPARHSLRYEVLASFHSEHPTRTRVEHRAVQDKELKLLYLSQTKATSPMHKLKLRWPHFSRVRSIVNEESTTMDSASMNSANSRQWSLPNRT